MTVLWINLFLVYATACFARYYSAPSTIEPVYIQPNKLLVFLLMSLFVLVSGFRNTIGDTSGYMFSYANSQLTLGNIDFTGEFGFYFLQLCLQQITHNPQLLIFTTAMITNLLIILVIKKYARLFELGLYVYITSGMFVVTMNGVRQSLAAAILFVGTKYLLEGNWKRYMLVVLIAFTFHNSALVLIPIYFIVRREAWTKVTLVLISLSILIVLGFNQFTSALFSVIGDTRYSEYSQFSGQGANVMRVVVNAVPLIFAYIGRHKLRSLFPKSDYIVNLALIGLIFKLISTQQWIFARFSIYFGFYNIILISWLVPLFVRKQQKLIYFCVIILYLFFFYYENVISLGLVYRSPLLTW
jgi:transmembrane protein EpsG